jgi:CRISPR-associated protein Cmr6
MKQMENSEVGKIIIRKNKKGKFIFEVALNRKQPMKIPDGHSLKDDSFNGKECFVLRENGQIKKVIVDGENILENRSVPPQNYQQNKNGLSMQDSFDISKAKVPKDTREALKDFKAMDNFYLKLNQFARFEEDGKPVFFKSTKGKVDFAITPNFGKFDFEKNLEKQKTSIEAIFGKNHHKKELKTSYRLVIGGEATVYKTSIRLHHIYGIPYIPASAIKGVLRSYIIIEQFESNENKALANENFIKIFGGQLLGNEDLSSSKEDEVETSLPMQEGKVIFFDAFPTSKPTLKVDIINPHYGHYYNDGKAPTDTHNPVPINFLTVENTTFQFFIASKESLDSFKIKSKTIEEWLTEALQNHGIGAKTAVGYGYF